MHNRDEFIREITLRICSSLEIKESLRSAFEYLREQVPLDVLAIFIIDRRLGAIRHIAHAFEKDAVPPDEIIPLPEGMPEAIAARDFRAPFIVDAGEDEIFSVMGPLAKHRREYGPDRSFAYQGRAAWGADLARMGRGAIQPGAS